MFIGYLIDNDLCIRQLFSIRDCNSLSYESQIQAAIHDLIALAHHDLSSLNIDKYPNGSRKVVGQKEYRVSLSHDGEYTVLLTSDTNACIGIDIDHDTLRDISLLQERVVLPQEQKLINHSREAFSAIWAIKEAALKAWGIGMRIAPWDICVDVTSESLKIHSLNRPELPILSGTAWAIAPRYHVACAWGENAYTQVEPNYYVKRPLHLGC